MYCCHSLLSQQCFKLSSENYQPRQRASEIMSEFKSEQPPLEDRISTPQAGATRKILAEVAQDGNKVLRSTQKASSDAVLSAFPDLEIVPNQHYIQARDVDPPKRIENPNDGAMAPRKEEEPPKDVSAAKKADQLLSATSPAWNIGKWVWKKIK